MKNYNLRNISSVILSGGKSSRMGEDKSLLKFSSDNSMCEYQYKKLLKIFDKVYISSKIDKFDFLNEKDQLILDRTDIFSPMVALDSIFERIEEEKIFIITVDMPLVSIEVINKLIEVTKGSNYEVVIVKNNQDNRHSLCGVFDRSIHSKVKKCLNSDIHKINYLINKCNYKELFFDDQDQFININTKEQYIQAQKLINNS